MRCHVNQQPAFYPGYQGGNAIAETILGTNNPGGKLPITIYKADIVNQLQMTSMSMVREQPHRGLKQLWLHSHFPHTHSSSQTKPPGRTYRYFTGEPLWPYGYGLSCTYSGCGCS